MKTNIPCVCLTITSVLFGCESAESSGAVVTDSAGVVIVQNPEMDLTQWQLSQQPLVAIGSETRGDEYQMFRVQGAVRMSDGRIAVANSGTSEVRIYDDTGEFITSSGSDGDGPGEFRAITSLQRLPGDTLFVYDRSLARYSILDPNGGFVRSSSMVGGDGGPGSPMALGLFGNGYVPAQQTRGGIFAFVAGEAEDPNTEMSVEFLLLRGPDSGATTIGTYPAQQTRITMGEGSISVIRNPLAPETYAVADRNALFVGHSGAYEIHRYDETGAIDRIVRHVVHANPITDAEIDALIERGKESAPNADAARGIEASYRAMEYPETFPLFDDLLIDQVGWLWVRDYLRPTDEIGRWRIYSPDGVMTAQVFAPRDFTLMDAGRDYVLGRLRDELDLERVMLFALTDR
jgi:hypothetical protein